LSDAGLRENFSACVNLFQDFITQKKEERPNVTIAAVSNNQSHQQQPNQGIRKITTIRQGDRVNLQTQIL